MKRFAIPSSGNTLLAYSINTDPDPLQVSPSNGTMMGSLTIVVSNPTTAQYVYVSSIVFSFPIGTGAQALTNVATGITSSASPSAQWNFVQTGDGVFTATPKSGTAVQMGSNGAVFEIFGIIINTTPGNVTFSITESSSNSASGPFTPAKNGTAIIPKFPYGFFFLDFTPSAPAVVNNNTVTLTWEASTGPTYTMFYSGGPPAGTDVTNARSWTSPPLHEDATFLIQAVSQQGGQSVTTSLTTTVIVINGEPTLTGLTVTGWTAFVSQGSGPQVLTPPVSSGGSAATTSLRAPSDGIVIGSISANGGSGATPTQLSIGWITIQNSSNVYVAATGGNYIAYAQQNTQPGSTPLQFSCASLNQSITMPVKKSETFTIGVQMLATNQSTPVVAFWYIPFGSGTAAAPAAKQTDEASGSASLPVSTEYAVENINNV